MRSVQAVKSALELNDIIVENIYFNNYNPQLIKSYPQDKYDLGLKLSYREEDLNLYRVDISLNVGIEDGTDEMLLTVGIYGIFNLHNSEALPEDKKQRILEVNTASILFPYLRSLVTTISANSGIPPLILPTINMEQLVKEQRK